MESSPLIFNETRRLNFIKRATKLFAAHDFLYQWTAKDMVERLQDIKRDFKSVLFIGPHTNHYFQATYPHAHILETPSPENLAPLAGKFDCILSIGELHAANDLPGTLIQMRRALKPDGMMMAAFAGGETLFELRESLMYAEMNISGGASPRVYPFADKQQMAGLMQRAGFSLPVVDSEILTISYRDLFHVMDDLRGMGDQNALMQCHTSFTSSRLFFEAEKYYQDKFAEQDGRVSATYEIIFLIGWAPHESQQKPARRGSGQVSLTDVL